MNSLVKMMATWKMVDRIHAIVVAVVLMFSLSIWVHYSFQGEYWGPFLPGAHFGVPAQESEMGMYPTSHIGWDGQFYYYQSNDIFATKDASQHIDNPPYRYQRIGVPLMAGGIATLFGFETTPPILYLYLQLILVASGFYFLAKWLRNKKISAIYGYGWILSIGVLNGLAYGMPDAVGDAMFIVAIIAALQGKLIFYAIVSTFLLLVREGYAVFAAMVFGLTLFGSIPWDKYGKWGQVMLTMLPGIVSIAWMGYVTIRFGKPHFQAAMGTHMTDWPFHGIWVTFWAAIEQKNWFEIFNKLLGVGILFWTVWLVWRNRKESPVWYAVLAYCLVAAVLGTTVWSDWSGYMKALGSLLAVLVILLVYEREQIGRATKILLLLMAVYGVVTNYALKRNAFFSEWVTQPAVTAEVGKNEGRLPAFGASFKLIDQPVSWHTYGGLFSPVHRSETKIRVRIFNESDVVWYALPYKGINSINFSYHWYDASGKDLLYDGTHTPIGSTVRSGEALDLTANVMMPPPGHYVLRLSMIQEGHAWFYNAEGGYLDVPVTVVSE